jgi:membrane-associated protease RseP (regulator of RpoE activity)
MSLFARHSIVVLVAFALGLASGAYGFGGGDTPTGDRTGVSGIEPIGTTAGGEPSRLAELRALVEASERERQRLANELFGLEERVVMLEEALESGATPVAASGDPKPDVSESQAETVQEPGLTEAALVQVGMEPQLAASLVRRQAEIEMRRLELRDEATRDGWFAEQRYFEALAELNAQETALREEIGDRDYERYLYASGEDNRVLVSSVIPGSPAEQAGLRSGDVVLSYAGQQLFSGQELRSETTRGERGEPITVRVRRGDSELDVLLPRGPMGVRLDSARVEPRD